MSNITSAGGSTGSSGTKTYAVFTPIQYQPPATFFATPDTRTSIAVLDFDDSTGEDAIFVGIIPEGANLGSGLKIRIKWTATSATSGNCIWTTAIMALNATTDIDADSFDSTATVTTAAPGTSGFTATSEITITTIDSLAAGESYRIKISRNAGSVSDTMTGDAEVHAVEVRSAA